MEAAVTKKVDIKEATCPHCSATRIFVVKGGKPEPLEKSGGEIARSRFSIPAAVFGYHKFTPKDGATELFEDGIIDSAASFKPNSLAGRVVFLSNEGKKIYKFHVAGNDDTGIWGLKPLRKNLVDTFQPTDLQYSISDPSPDVSKIYGENVFVCQCGKSYTVDKV